MRRTGRERRRRCHPRVPAVGLLAPIEAIRQPVGRSAGAARKETRHQEGRRGRHRTATRVWPGWFHDCGSCSWTLQTTSCLACIRHEVRRTSSAADLKADVYGFPRGSAHESIPFCPMPSPVPALAGNDTLRVVVDRRQAVVLIGPPRSRTGRGRRRPPDVPWSACSYRCWPGTTASPTG